MISTNQSTVSEEIWTSADLPPISAVPQVVSREEAVSVEAGSETELECVATGNPQPVITWRRLGSARQEHQVTSLSLSLDFINWIIQ